MNKCLYKNVYQKTYYISTAIVTDIKSYILILISLGAIEGSFGATI